jgi:hypothetical protein
MVYKKKKFKLEIKRKKERRTCAVSGDEMLLLFSSRWYSVLEGDRKKFMNLQTLLVVVVVVVGCFVEEAVQRTGAMNRN